MRTALVSRRLPNSLTTVVNPSKETPWSLPLAQIFVSPRRVANSARWSMLELLGET